MIEILIVAVLVVWSALVVFKKVFPNTHAQSSRSCLMPVQQGWHTLAKWLKPAMASGCGGNCACRHRNKAQIKT